MRADAQGNALILSLCYPWILVDDTCPSSVSTQLCSRLGIVTTPWHSLVTVSSRASGFLNKRWPPGTPAIVVLFTTASILEMKEINVER